MRRARFSFLERAVGAGAFAVSLFATRSSFAEASRTLDLHYDAPPTCPSADDFRAQLDLRVTPDVPAQVPAPISERASVDVRLAERAGGFVGTVAVAHRGMVEQRSLEAPQCEALANALALATSFLLEAVEDTNEQAPHEPPPPAPQAAEGAASPRPVAEPKVPSPLDRAEHRPVTAPGAFVGIGVLGGLHGTWGPRPIPNVAAVLEAEWDRGQSVLSPSARASASYAAAARDAIALRAMILGIDACPLRVQVGARVTLRPCLGIEVGRIDGRGRGLLDVQTQVSGWFAASAVARVHVAIAGPLVATADLGGTLPFTRPRFYAGPDAASPDSTLFRAPPLGVDVTAGLLVRIP